MWAQIINALIGLIIMISPEVLGFSTNEANINHILGPLIFTFAVISFWECNRNVRLFNIPTGVGLIILALVFNFQSNALLVDAIAGMLLIIFSLIKGKVEQKFGGGWRSLFIKDPLHSQTK